MNEGLAILLACLAGVLVGLSRQLNGRLALSSTPLVASFWNHAVGFAALTLLGLVVGGLLPAGASAVPWYAWIGGPVGVVFVAAGAWVIARIGALNTALLIIAGQMVSGVVVDLLQGTAGALWPKALGVLLIIAGTLVAQERGGSASRDGG